MNELAKLRTKRERIRSLTTSLLARIESQLRDAYSSDLLDEYYEQLDAKEKIFAELDAKIEGQIFEEKVFEVEVEESEIWREKCISYKSKIGKAIRRINERELHVPPPRVFRSSCPTPSSDSGIAVTPLAASPYNKEAFYEGCLKIEDVRSLSTNDQTEDVVNIVVPDQLEIPSASEDLTSFVSSPTIVRRCEDCDTDFQFETQLVKHRLEVHRDVKPFKCRQCDFTTGFKSSLMTHLRLHTGEKPYRCAICGDRFRVRITMKKHLLTHKKHTVVPKPRKCEFCEFSTTAAQAMASHLRKHDVSERFKCSKCDKSFATQANLLNHDGCHSAERPFRCPMCFKEFAKKASLKSHVRKLHQVIDFDLPRELTYKPFKCSVCMARFKFRASLISHQKNEHSLAARTTAEEESPSMTSLDNAPSPAAHSRKRKSHASGDTIITDSASPSTMSIEKDSADLEPSLISTAFRKDSDGFPHEDFTEVPEETFEDESEASLTNAISKGRDSDPKAKRTRQTRTVKPLRCKECSRDFQENYSFEKHCFDVHGDSKPYKCQFCEHSTSNSLLLFVHLRSHENRNTSTNIFKCQKCEESFTTGILLRRHVRSSHDDILEGNNDKDDIQQDILKYEGDELKFPSDGLSKNNSPIRQHRGTSSKNSESESISPQDKSYHCDFCPKHFATKGSLSKHLRKHRGMLSGVQNEHSKSDENSCSKSLQNESTLRILIKPLPKAITDATTGVSNDSFLSSPLQSTISSGLQDDTPNSNYQNVEAMPSTPVKPTPFKCVYCDRGFSRKLNLTLHVKAHIRRTSQYEKIKEQSESQVAADNAQMNEAIISHNQARVDEECVVIEPEESAKSELNNSQAEVTKLSETTEESTSEMENMSRNYDFEPTIESVPDTGETEGGSSRFPGKMSKKMAEMTKKGASSSSSTPSLVQLLNKSVSVPSTNQVTEESVSSKGRCGRSSAVSRI